MSGKRDKTVPTPPAVPENAKRELGIGTFAGLLFAEAMSSVRLFGLGERVGFAWYLAWLLPGALDIYAITMVRFFSRLPATLPLRRKAAHEAIIALVITVGCNALYETVLQFSSQLPAWAPGVLFVLVSSLPPFVAGRLIHFRSEVGNGTVQPDSVIDTVAPTLNRKPRQKTDTARGDQTTLDTDTQGPGNDTGNTESGNPNDSGSPAPTDTSEHPERSMPWWAERAAPLYRQWMREHNGTAPKAPMLADLLIKAGYDVPAGEVQRRKIRAATETRLTENSEPEPEPERVGATS